MPRCTHDDCLRDGARGFCLEEQQKFLIENWRSELDKNYKIALPSDNAGHYLDPKLFIMRLLEAQDLVSRAEQKKEENMYPRCNFKCKYCQNQLNPNS